MRAHVAEALDDVGGAGEIEVALLGPVADAVHHALAGRELSRTALQRTPLGRRLVWGLITALEAARIAPKGTMEVSQFLHTGADALVRGGDLGVFTPMAFFLAHKPA